MGGRERDEDGKVRDGRRGVGGRGITAEHMPQGYTQTVEAKQWPRGWVGRRRGGTGVW